MVDIDDWSICSLTDEELNEFLWSANGGVMKRSPVEGILLQAVDTSSFQCVIDPSQVLLSATYWVLAENME